MFAALVAAADDPGRGDLTCSLVDLAFQLVQMVLVIALAPLLTGMARKVKARLTRRRGASIFQPYRDLYRLAHKEATGGIDLSVGSLTAFFVVALGMAERDRACTGASSPSS